jgi:hypothetical protein
MQLLATPEFQVWAAGHGIGWDPRYPGANQLSFLEAPDHWHAWDSPPQSKRLAWFAESVLRVAASEDQSVLVLPRARGQWRFGGVGSPKPNQALDLIMRGLGVPAEFVGAVRFDASEFAHLLAVAVASLVFGWSTGEDLYILPASGRCILLTSHDCAIFGFFPSKAGRESLQESPRRFGASCSWHVAVPRGPSPRVA